MPSKVTYWYTHHEGISLLHVSSNDPRRGGSQDLAMFDSDVYAGLIGNEWRVRSGRIENQFGQSFLSVIAPLYNLGSIQIEPNIDYRSSNFRKRVFSGAVPEALAKFREDPQWRTKKHAKKHELFPLMKWKKRSDWVELEVSVDDGVKLKIKINKCLVQYVPKNLVWRPHRRNQLYLLPNAKQAKRNRAVDDRRHGQALTERILNNIPDACIARMQRSDPLDYRFDYATNTFCSAITPRNTYHKVAEGTVLEVHWPANYGHADELRPKNVYPDKELFFLEGEARSGYFLIDDNVVDEVKQYDWTMNYKLGECFSKNVEDKSGSRYKLEKLVAKLNKVEVNDRVVQSRMTRGYRAAVDGGVGKYKERAAYENRTPDEMSTNNRMFTKRRIYKFRKFHCDKFLAIPELNIIALDVRFNSIRIGGAK